MNNGRGPHSRAHLAALGLAAFALAASLTGCAAPGEPTTRRPPIPTPITDLTAKQQGNDVTLEFTLPTESIDHHPLKTTPSVQVLRSVNPAGAITDANTALTVPPTLTLLATLPPATINALLENRKVKFVEPLSAHDFSAQASLSAVYVIRTYETEKKPSSDSNAIALTLRPAYLEIADAKAENARDGVAITWTPPTKTLSGTAPPIATYRIYRTAIPENTTGVSVSASTPVQKPLQLAGAAAAPPFLDSQIELGTRYLYSVRTVATYGAAEVESSDSNPAEVTARDLFPPAAPDGLIVTLIPAQPAGANGAPSPAYLDLSWAIAPESDVTGYNVYRSDSATAPGKRQNSDLLPTPAFRDMNAAPGRTYYYTVTAVDRAGNESAPSAAVAGSVSEEAPANP